MPSSDNVTIPYVASIIGSLRPTSALDVGVGMGKFGFFFREAMEWSRCFAAGVSCVQKANWQTRLDGIEVCREYVTPLQEYLYDKIYIARAEETVQRIGHYDLIHLGDVLEHLDRAEGGRLVAGLFEKARLGVLVVTPVGTYDQAGAPGNAFEAHRSVWSPKDLRGYPCVWSRKVNRRQWVIFIARERYWFPDPTARRHDSQQEAESAATRSALKSFWRALFGRRGVDLLLRAKQRMEGWK